MLATESELWSSLSTTLSGRSRSAPLAWDQTSTRNGVGMNYVQLLGWLGGVSLALATLGGCSKVSASKDDTEATVQPIRNGVPLEGDAPFFGIVAITNGALSFGTGTLLADNWVLTAGHVTDKLRGNTSQMRVRLGDKNDPGAQERGVVAVYLHPQHTPGGAQTAGDVDVALLRLSSGFTADATIRTISTSTSAALLNQKLTCYGYGLVADADTTGGLLTFANDLKVTAVNGNEITISEHIDPSLGSQLPLKGDSGGSCVNSAEEVVGVISIGDTAVPAKIASLDAAAAFRSWALGIMSSCSTLVPGSTAFCSAACPCPYGYGDCNSSSGCSTSNVCDSNVGAAFGLGPTSDVCVTSACAAKVIGSQQYCSADCPCGYGGGDCNSASGCQDGLTCDSNVGAGFKMSPTSDICVPPACALFTLGAANYCSASCPCGHGGGDCDNDAQCMRGLVCRSNIGPAFNMSATTDICVPPTCPTAQIFTQGFCTAACPCGQGGGDCNSDQDCMPGLICGEDNGAEFGHSATTDICVRP